jgi:hypothetical protein
MTQEIQLEIDRLKKQLQNQNIPASLKEKISLKIKGLEDTVEKTEEQVQVIEKKEEKLEQKAEGDLSEAIERMEKQLKNPQIPNSLKDKIREKIEKAKADIKEVKKEQVEEKKIKEEKVAQAKQEVKETLKKVKEVIKKTSTPKEKTEEVKKAVAKSSEAVQKAKKATEESTKSTKKRTSRLTGALRELQQIINANPTLKALYKGKGVDLKRDAARQAKPVGYRFKGKHNYRIPKNLDNPNVYYEGRPDKGDAYQNKRRGVYFADGGMMADGGDVGEVQMYYHKTSGGAEYLCSEKVRGTNEGSMKSKYVVRIDGAKNGSEMSVIKKYLVNDTLKKILKMYYHKTSGGAEYLCSSKVRGTNEGDLKSKYVVRIDGAKRGSEMIIKGWEYVGTFGLEEYADGGMMAKGEEIRGGIRYVKGKELEWYDIMGFDIADYGEKEAERKAYDYIQDSIKYWNGELNEEDFKVRRIGGGKDYKGRPFDSWVVMRQFPKYADGGMMSDGGMMARGGKTKSRYNEGLSWHQDHARFNKSEKYEKPLKRRRKY